MKVGAHSPWGTIDHSTKFDKNIFLVGTPRHGGFKVYAALNKKIPEQFRRSGGWYEEDCEANIVIHFLRKFLPERFQSLDTGTALRYWYPAACAKHPV